MARPLSITLLSAALLLGVWDCLLNLSLTTLHGLLLDSVGRAGVWVVIAGATVGGGWAVCREEE